MKINIIWLGLLFVVSCNQKRTINKVKIDNISLKELGKSYRHFSEEEVGAILNKLKKLKKTMGIEECENILGLKNRR